MPGGKKKHQSGASKNFITRTQAVNKLQVSLADFRRLCIFKGIYPREPRNKKKANKGSTKATTFYYSKDIDYLQHELVLGKFREHKAFAKKLTRALGRGEVGDAKRLDDNRPKYKLDHIIKERYPTFMDSIRDIDDALSMLFLFSAMPATTRISHAVTAEAEKLCNQWMAYVAREHLLRKVFVSIKGTYYQAVIKGEPVLWLVPFKFPQNLPNDVDFKIMLTFLEFYTTLLKFVLFKLYTDSGLVYPPPVDSKKISGVGGISAYVLEAKSSGIESVLPALTSNNSNGSNDNFDKAVKSIEMDKAIAEDLNNEDNDEIEEDEEENETKLDSFTVVQGKSVTDSLEQPTLESDSVAQLFSKFVFYIGREVPLDILEFLISSCGAIVVSESALDELIGQDEDEISQTSKNMRGYLDKITHQICDRPSAPNKVPGRTYVQPQWVFDSINKGELLPVSDYAPGETLPPHLSPWGDSGGYDPEAPLEAVEGEDENEDEDEEIEVEEDDEEEEELDEAVTNQREIELEAAGVKYSEVAEKKDNKSKNSKKRSASDNLSREEKEEKDLRKMMMSNKQKKLYNQMQYSNQKKETRQEDLRKKKRKIEKTKGKLNQKK